MFNVLSPLQRYNYFLNCTNKSHTFFTEKLTGEKIYMNARQASTFDHILPYKRLIHYYLDIVEATP